MAQDNSTLHVVESAETRQEVVEVVVAVVNKLVASGEMILDDDNWILVTAKDTCSYDVNVVGATYSSHELGTNEYALHCYSVQKASGHVTTYTARDTLLGFIQLVDGMYVQSRKQ